MCRSSALILALLQGQAFAHTFIWGVFVNGVDQGSFKGIRIPAYNGAPGQGGYNNSPVKNLTSIDLRCNVMGDVQAADTIKVAPGDNLTFDWHHDKRSTTDDVIADSHHGPSLVYISPDPPTENSFVKLWHSGLYEESTFPNPGKWSTTSDIAKNQGSMNVRIPKGLKAGHYIIRAEMIGLHEGEVSFEVNPIRGAQFYPNCVQIEVTGDGDVELPEGVSFPGAYSYEDPGVVYDVYCSTNTKTTKSTSCITTYPIPGPTVWSGAYAETTQVPLAQVTGVTTHPDWSTWIKKSAVTSATYTNKKSLTIVGSQAYTASWSTTYQTPAPNTKVGHW
ncbi:lytic polysaccharide monooxygenase [Aaosphaeria arxii CBS 175.79]|uniref:AA9 family lytic polysaccharide monooxygenase n=1 Tax=Aaosphaeria arxii CBS 175.79 TaxID=1450172 RepID=A0A6A5XLB8_9PLEO|nr:lytic polysaccharide monooxygenase [Aaosphaeria arxii CBS 175.79]KAF2013686.1 lytic polysaccharide monooxygenase [Aaosphaeria arxii CBS 175.79]